MNRFVTRSETLDNLAGQVNKILVERMERRGISRNQAWNELTNELESRIIAGKKPERTAPKQPFSIDMEDGGKVIRTTAS